jgi:hypothetical protein
MKKNIIFFIITLISILSFGQNITTNNVTSNFTITPEMLDVNNFTNRFHTVIDNGSPKVINVKFHGVHETDGTDSFNINEERFLKIIASLNVNFNQFNIFFKYRGYNIINNSTYLYGYFPNWVDYTTQQGYFDENSINIMINNGGGYTTGGGSNAITMTTQLSDANTINGFSPFYDKQINYLMGFTLGLLPIDIRSYLNSTVVSNNIPTCVTAPFMYKAYFVSSPGFLLPENVTRDTNDLTNYNAENAGDMVADTQACFDGFTQNYCTNPPFQNFMQHPDVVDPTQTMYNCTAVESHNFMLNSNYGGIPNSFTSGQGARMRQFIISNPNRFNSVLNLLDSGDSDFSVLYEPFAVSGGNGSNDNTTTAYSKTYTTNSTNTGANVWNCGPFTMRFQTGFDCEFYPYNASTITQTPYQHLDYPTSTSVNVNIPILGEQIYQNVAPVCFYSFEPFTSGDVKSLDNLGSSYFTQEELDKIKASDPKLFEELHSDKYHIITKQTDSGFIDQKIIFKK